jgi:hypothetical protein
VDEYAFLNASDTEPYFDVFSPPAGLKLVEITRAPLKSDGNPYWENEWDVWVVSIEDYLAFHRIAFNSAT